MIGETYRTKNINKAAAVKAAGEVRRVSIRDSWSTGLC